MRSRLEIILCPSISQELLSINGLSESAYWAGNFLAAFVEMFMVQTPLILLFNVNPITGTRGLWFRSSYLVLIVFFTAYSAAASCFAIIVAIISPRRK